MIDTIEKGFSQQQLSAITDVFTTDGWKLIQRDMKLYKKQMDSAVNIESERELWHLKGELNSLEWFINLAEWYQAAEAIHEADI